MDVLDGRAVVALGNHELLPALDELDTELNRLQTLRLQVIARVEDTGHAQELGARDAVDLLAFRYRQDRPEAWRDVRLARTLPKYSTTNTALTHGITTQDTTRPLRTAHATAIITELERIRPRVPAEDLDIAEQQLVQLAAHLAPKELRSAAKQICNLLDSDGPEPDESKAYDRETLTLTPADHGVTFRGYLANDNAELLRAIIHTGARPHKTTTGDPDPRPHHQRQADALTTALSIAATTWDTNTTPTATAAGSIGNPTGNPTGDRNGERTGERTGDGTGGSSADRRRRVPGYGAKANITVTIDLQDLKAATATAIGHTVYSDGLSAATIRRLACDANVIPLVLGSNSEPLDVGRRERLVTRPIRRALNARDKGCVICAAPPIMCDAHHLISWIDGGETTINNLALACRRHHTEIHHGHWNLTITNGLVHVTRPTWANPPTTPTRPPAKPPTGSPASAPPAPDIPGTEPARPDPPTREHDPWSGTRLPTAGIIGVRSSRWKADGATLAEAARFAVRGIEDTTEPGTGPPSFATI